MPHLRRLAAIAFLAALVAVAALGCSGDDGPTGPAGTANVIHSAWKTGNTTSRDTTIDGTLMKYYTISAPPLTQEHLDGALIAVYMRAGTLGPYLLPYASTAGSAPNTIGFFSKVGLIYLNRVTPSAAAYANLVNLPQSLEYRYIIVPGGVVGASAHEVIDWSDYAAVKARFGLQD